MWCFIFSCVHFVHIGSIFKVEWNAKTLKLNISKPLRMKIETYNSKVAISMCVCVCLIMCRCIYMYVYEMMMQTKKMTFYTCKDSPLLLVAMVTCSRLPSEDGSVISSESVKAVSGKGLSVQKATTQQKLTKEDTKKSNGEKCLHCFSLFCTCAVRPQAIS